GAVAPPGAVAQHGGTGPPQERGAAIVVLFKAGACRYRLLPDGRRQIVDVLLPGDIIGLGALFKPRAEDFVHALTEIACGELDHASLFRLLGDPEVALHVMAQLAAESRRLDTCLTTVGQMVAEER